MSLCMFCGQEAGFLQNKHKACEAKHIQGGEQIMHLARSAIVNKQELDTLHAATRSVSDASFIKEGERIDLLVKAFDDSVTEALNDGLLTAEEEEVLSDYGKRLSLTPEDWDKHGGYTRMVQGGLLRDLTEGKVPARMTLRGSVPFNLQKSELMVWLFNDVKYHEVRTRTRIVGGTQGVSLRIARGVYYRLGAFAAEPVKSEETVLVGKGVMLVTTKNVYFGSSLKSLRIPYNKIVVITPYSDGVGIQRDAVSAKPQLFTNGAGWFTYNLLMNLSQNQQ